MIKVISVFGTRPEAIKMAPVVKALEAAAEIESQVVVTPSIGKCLIKFWIYFKSRPIMT